MAETIRSHSPSLAELYSECITSFADFIETLTEPDCDVICRDEIQLPRIFEEYGRTKIWGDQSKADLPAGARGSLDDILRHDFDLKSLVHGILKRLRDLLHQATHIANRKCDPDQSTDQESISSVSDSDYSTDNEDQPQNRRMPKVRLFFKQITDQIRSLHEISSLLRRPTVTDKFLRSRNAGLELATPRDPDSSQFSVAFRPFDENHVLEKVIQWRGLRKSQRTIKLPDEATAPASNAPLYQEMEGARWFYQRLARANTRRREQLRYWKIHPYVSKQPITATLTEGASITRGVVPLEDYGAENAASVFSNLSFSTVDFSDVHDTKTNTQPRTIYAPTASGPDRAISIPAPPKLIAGETTFLCPYCGMALDVRDRRDLWKRHVFRDLRPYICTIKDCQSAEKMFSSRHEWRYHEFQIHRREYVCRRCPIKYASRTEMSIHLEGHSKEVISPDQMGVLLNICDRQVDPYSSNKELCVLCGDNVPLSKWHDHVGAHMETLSLFVLPVLETDEEENEGSINSGKADNPDLNEAHNSEASSLRFSETQDHSQMSNSLDVETTEIERGGSASGTTYSSNVHTFRAFKSKEHAGERIERTSADGRSSVTYNHRARGYEPNSPSPKHTDSSYKPKNAK